MVVMESHIVNNVEGSVRFIDYCIGVFPLFSTRNAVKKALKKKQLTLNGAFATTGVWVKNNDRIDHVDPQHSIPKPFPLKIELIYEDEFLAIVNKPSGIVVSGNIHRTLENALIGTVNESVEKDALKWAKPVHRLDSATSGLIVFSKTAEAHRRISKMFEEKSIQKKYRAVVQGSVDDQIITSAIEDKACESRLKVLQKVNSLQNESLTLVELEPRTGRTHQLRIHCASLDSPIVGDQMYGTQGNIMKHKGLFLAAIDLKFIHPMTGEDLHVNIDQPAKFDALLERESKRWTKFNS